jgi:hypothetical protein
MPANFLAPWQPCPAIRRPIGKARCAVGRSTNMRSTAGFETEMGGAVTAARTFTATLACTLTKRPSARWDEHGAELRRRHMSRIFMPSLLDSHDPTFARAMPLKCAVACSICAPRLRRMRRYGCSRTTGFPRSAAGTGKIPGWRCAIPSCCLQQRRRCVSPHSMTEDTLDDHNGYPAPAGRHR